MKAEAAEPEPVQAMEKKPELGVVHLAAPKISQKRTVQAAAAPDAGILNDDQPAADASDRISAGHEAQHYYCDSQSNLASCHRCASPAYELRAL